jgi:tripartite-type tricarboxylate transporter receptor subunit TctC
MHHLARSVRVIGRFLMPLIALSVTSGTNLAAESFPSKPLRIVVPAAPGGNLDNVTRIVALKLSEQLGQAVIVENRPGANYMIAVEHVRSLPADGYTYLAIADSFLAAPLVAPTAKFDPVKDFVGVSLVATVPELLVVNPSVQANSVKDLIALAKSKPGGLSFGSAGVGYSAHIAAALFSTQAGVKMTHIPYKGNAPALVDVMGGRVSLIFDTISTSLPQVKAGRLKALGVTSATRSPLLPNVPTVSEAGLPGYESVIFNGLVAKAGTPPEILNRMNSAIREILQRKDVREKLMDQGVEPAGTQSYEQFSAYMKSQGDKYAKVIQKAEIHTNL